MEINGKLKTILPAETGTSKAGKEWSSQSIVLDTGDKFNPDVCIKFFGDKAELLNGLKTGDKLTVSINVSSREYNSKWYHSIDGWKIEAGTVKESDTIPESDEVPF